jgi:hypothetical protein
VHFQLSEKKVGYGYCPLAQNMHIVHCGIDKQYVQVVMCLSHLSLSHGMTTSQPNVDSFTKKKAK